MLKDNGFLLLKRECLRIKDILLEGDESCIVNEKIGSTTRKSHMCLLFGNVTGNAQDSLALKI